MTEFSQTYWNDLLEKYRNGTISEQDRFQLEKQALDDPFLFDALEGFSLFQESSEEKRKANKLITLPRMAIAASLVLLVAVIFNLKSNLNTTVEEDQSIAMVLEKDKSVASESEEPIKIEESSEDLDVSKTSTIEPPQKVSNNPSKPKTAKVERSSQIASGDNKAEVEKIIPSKPPSVIGANSRKVVDADEENGEEMEVVKREEELAVLENKEVVLDGVAVAKDEDQSVEVVNAASFDNVKQETENEIVPIDSRSKKLDESSDNFAKKAKALATYQAVPVIGKEIFDDYAKQRIDERGLRQETPQKVTIEFKIDENGNLTDFHHIFTGCPECGPFAISILQNSGEWKTVPPGYSGKARYTFTF